MKTLTPLRNPPALLYAATSFLLAAISACSSVDPYAENREYLDKSAAALGKGEYRTAAKTAEALLAGRAEQASEFRLQRYFAAFLCARAHVEAALHGAFMNEAAPSGAGLGIASAASAKGGAVGSPTAHWVAASYYSRFARDLFAAAAKEKPVHEKTELLPPALKALEIQRAQANLDLTRLAVLRRLGFESDCAAILDASPDVLDVEQCQATLESAQLPAELRPLVFYAGFAHLKLRANPADSRSQATTYHLGAQARLLADATPGSLPAAFADDVVRWTETNPNFEFQCKCNRKFQPTALRCPECAASIVQFSVREKTRSGP